MNQKSHPIEFVSRFIKGLPDGAELEFSKYVYVPQSIAESRKVFSVAKENLSEAFQDVRARLEPNEEIAFHSRIQLRHFPMIDMGCAAIEKHIPELKRAFSDFNIPSFSVYSSGRSFHIYGHGLLENDRELIRFMGRILLLNLPGSEHVIDERWVGHRLMAGYSTLRWTNNNPHYKQMPTHFADF